MSDAEVLAGYDRERRYDMGVLYGRGGRDLMDALDTVNSPAGHAILMIGIGIVGAWMCFSRARVVESDERSLTPDGRPPTGER